jgi:hypothetical protein
LSWQLYQVYALFEDRKITGQTLNLSQPNISLGIAAGGLPVEGSLYGESLGTLMQSLVALKTAGYADPAISGPSVNMLTSTYWDKMVDGLLNNIAPAPYFPAQPPVGRFRARPGPRRHMAILCAPGSNRTRSGASAYSASSTSRPTTGCASTRSAGSPPMC